MVTEPGNPQPGTAGFREPAMERGRFGGRRPNTDFDRTGRSAYVDNLITTTVELERVVDEALDRPRYAIDTEFHRERTYFPQVALVQMAYGETVVLIDPLAVDLAPLARLLEGPGVCIMHAGIQDLEVLDLSCGAVPTTIFDTQIAAGFLGVSTGSLASILKRFLGVQLGKGDRLTDWLRRPLTKNQLHYAASDVEYLLELTDLLEQELEQRGRLEWAREESRLLRERPRNRRLPEEAILRIKEARSLRGKSFRVATVVAAWRERRAAELNVPVRQVLPDLGVVAIAQGVPSTDSELRSLRGVDGRHLRDGAERELLAAVQTGLRMPADDAPSPRNNELSKNLRPVVTLVTSWVSQIARDNELDAALLATRADVESLLKGEEDCRLLEGWRQRLVGAPIANLVGGRAAVAFDGDGRLVLERRSGQPLDDDSSGGAE